MRLFVFLAAYAIVQFLVTGTISDTAELRENGVELDLALFKRGNSTTCYHGLGCIVTTKGWFGPRRTNNKKPFSPRKIGTYFRLYTRENLVGERLIRSKRRKIISKQYKRMKDTKLIIHGFLSDASVPWVVEMTQLLLGKMDINVITVDYSRGVHPPYIQAAANARIVGLEIAFLINTIIEKYGGSAEKFHLIGHSLGAHVAGYAGERINGLGRITGLDPAGPLFTGMPTFVRLDKSDAKFVDVIHTDASLLGYGSAEAFGHVDFYPNGGNNQPGCNSADIPELVLNTEFLKTIKGLPYCSHGRSYSLFMESITSSPFLSSNKEQLNCPFISFACDSYEDFIDGHCMDCGKYGMNCALMGIDADKYPGRGVNSTAPRKFYLRTHLIEPYCGYHYAMNMKISPESQGQRSTKGDILVTAFGEFGSSRNMHLTKRPREIVTGRSYSFLGFSPVNTGHIAGAAVLWERNSNSIRKKCLSCTESLLVSDIELINMGFYPSQKFEKSSLCKNNYSTAFISGFWTLLSFRC